MAIDARPMHTAPLEPSGQSSLGNRRLGAPCAGGLGFWALTSLVVGNVIGSSIFLLPSLLAPFGGLAIVSWLITSAGAIFLALVFARLAAEIPKAGGPYAYTRVAFGDFTGFLIAGATGLGSGPALRRWPWVRSATLAR